MTTIDIILLFIAVVALFYGAYKGFVHQLGTIAGVILGIVACRVFGDDVASWFIGPATEHPDIVRMVAYICLFIVVFLSISLLGRLLKAILSAVKLSFVDRIAGALFSAAIWLLLTSIAINAYLVIVPSDASRFNVRSKPWRGWVAGYAPSVLGYLTNTQHS